MNRILSFCGHCGIILPEGLGLKDNQDCPNCDLDVSKREHRPEGTFSEEDATRLEEANW